MFTDFNHITKLTSFGAKSLLGHLFKQGQNERKRGQPMNDTSAVVKLVSMLSIWFHARSPRKSQIYHSTAGSMHHTCSALQRPATSMLIPRSPRLFPARAISVHEEEKQVMIIIVITIIMIIIILTNKNKINFKKHKLKDRVYCHREFGLVLYSYLNKLIYIFIIN